MTTSEFLSGSMKIEGNQKTYMKHRITNYARVKSMQIKERQSKAMTCKHIQRTITQIGTRHLDARTNQPTNKQTNKQNTNLASNQSKEPTHLRTNQITKPTNQQMHQYANETNEPTNEWVATHISFRNLISI